MDYRFKPLGTRKISYLIDPCHVIALEDLALMIKHDCIYKIAHGVVSKQLPLYFHYKTEDDGKEQNMLCFPLEFYFEYEIEYYFVRHRIYFLKRDVQTFFKDNQDIAILDSVLKVPKERIANKDNIKEITRNIVQRMCVVRDFEISSYTLHFFKALYCLFVVLCISLKIMLALPVALYDWFIRRRTYATTLLNNYDGTTLLAMTFTGAQNYVNMVLIEHNISIAHLKKHTELRAKMAVILYDAQLSIMDIGKLLHHSSGQDVQNDSLERVVREWLALGRKNSKED